VSTVGATNGLLRQVSHLNGFVKSLEFHHRLRACNAYPYQTALDLYRGKVKLTSDAPMAYKSCRDFLEPMKSGDKLEFKVGEETAGTFSVSGLPSNDAVLLLIIHRHDTLSTAVSFESHVFADLNSPQIAVIDTYKGKARGRARIFDGKPTTNLTHGEELRYNSVVAVNPGVYEVELVGQDDKTEATHQLVALNHESYVILRAGLEAQAGASFPEELIVFPASDAMLLRSFAGCLGAPLTVLALASIIMMLQGK